MSRFHDPKGMVDSLHAMGFKVLLWMCPFVSMYRADDSYFNYADSFVNNALSVRRLGEAMRLGRLGMQVALRTERAFAGLAYLGAEEVAWDVYHPRYASRDADARSQWRNVVKKGARAADDVFAVDVIRTGLRHGDQII